MRFRVRVAFGFQDRLRFEVRVSFGSSDDLRIRFVYDLTQSNNSVAEPIECCKVSTNPLKHSSSHSNII